jgi:hypothetical protein
MKIITFIFAIFIFGMAVMPCVHGIDEFNSEHVSETHPEDQSPHNSHDHEEDGCSPFCICQCCETAITIPLLFSFNETPEAGSFSRFHYPSLYSFEYPDGVWHPPTLS